MPKIVKKIISGGFEAVLDSAKQIAGTISPDKLVDQVLGAKSQRKDELGEYLKNLGPSLTEEELEKKKREFSAEELKQLEDARKVIKEAVPPHMKLPPRHPPPRPYELALQEEERKKAMAVEAQKKQQKPLVTPSGKQQKGMLFAVRKRVAKGFEGLQKDTKVG